MNHLLLLLGLFLLLFFLSRTLTRTISSLLLHIFRSQKIAIILFSLLFLPGTIIHELAHYVMAKILFVPTHGMNLIPKVEGNSVRLGSVMITQTDFLRRMLIGIAPFLVGSSLIFLLLYLASERDFAVFSLPMLLIYYAVFEIGNTMFASKKDMEGVINFLVIALVLCVVFFFFGVRIPEVFSFLNSQGMQELTQKGVTLFVFPIALDAVLIVVLAGIKKVLS